MRIIYILLVVSFFNLACSNDDDCTQETIVGTYAGSADCDEPSDPSIMVEPVNSLTIEHISGNNYAATGDDGTGYPFTVNGCNFDLTEVELDFFGITIKTSGDGSFDGDKITMNIFTEIDGEALNCTFVGSK